MNTISPIAHNYFTPAMDSFWEWSDEGEVLTWTNGKTILFKQELIEILTHLAPRGLPPLETLLILMAATRNHLQEDELLNIRDLVSTKLSHDLTISFKHVQQISSEIRSSLNGKTLIAEITFESSTTRGSVDDANLIIDSLKAGLGEAEVNPSSVTLNIYLDEMIGATIKELADLILGIKQLDTEKIKLRQLTGLDELPLAVPLEILFSEKVRQLIADLKQDEEHRGLAKLALTLLAAVALPRPMSEPEELALGGVSDICNRGPLDRLLLSELANDDLTLTVRLALNEAMYLRREAPPQTPKHCRALLIDCGIRTWGIPRIFTTAVALAMAATVDQHSEFIACRAMGSTIEPVDLSTKVGLIEHLQALESALHPANALPQFIKQFEQTELEAEPVLIITEDTWADTEFRHLLNQSNIRTFHIATVSREGRFQLIEKNLRGIKILREVTINIEDLFQEPQRTVSTIKDEDAKDLPAIFSVKPFPLLLSHGIDYVKQTTWRVPGFCQLVVTNQGQILLWKKPRQGAILLADNIPNLKGNHIHWKMGVPDDGRISFVAGNMKRAELVLVHIDVETLDVTSVPLEVRLNGCEAICSHNGYLFAVNYQRTSHNRQLMTIEVIDGMTGCNICNTIFSKEYLHRTDRFFTINEMKKWYAVSYNTQHNEAQLTSMSFGETDSNDIENTIERDPNVGPVAIMNHGHIYLTASNKLKKPKYQSQIGETIAISADGQKFAVKSMSTYITHTIYYFVDINTLHVGQSYYEDEFHHVEAPEFHIRHPINIRNNFTGMSVDASSQLILKSNKQYELALFYDSSCKQLLFRNDKYSIAPGHRKINGFKPLKLKNRFGFRLSSATWDDGSKAYLDSRGMLHLVSSDTDIPEVTLVLTDGMISGWCSDGRMWGKEYFTGDAERVDAKEIYDDVIRPFVVQLL